MLAFFEISLLITLAALLGLVANRLKQPPLLGYILAGVIISVLNIFGEDTTHSLELFSKIGITLLLFILGLELNLNDLKSVGKVALITGIAQIVVTTFVGFILAHILGFSNIASMYIAIGLAFSSTIVIVKLLSTKNDLNTVYGKVSIGFLLVQDFAAMLILMTLVATGTSEGGAGLLSILLQLIIKIPLLTLLLYVMSKYVLPWLIKQTNHDREVLFLLVIGWALFFASIVASPIFNFSIEIGALLAGIALSTRKETLQIESWTKSLRDFFLSVFFVLLGLTIDIGQVGSSIFPIFLFSIFVLIGNPLIVMFIMGLLGYNKRTSFFISLTVAQISEFSLLVASLGLQLGHLDQNTISIITVVGGITMAVSSYLIYYNKQIYDKLKPVLGIFEFRKTVKRGKYSKSIKDHTVIFGFHQLAEDIFEEVKANPEKYIIVDINPNVVDLLNKYDINVIYGDMYDTDIYEKLNLDKAKIIISTVPDSWVNIKLLDYMQKNKIDTPTVIYAKGDKQAFKLYKNGADYVLYPHLQTGQKLSKINQIEDNHQEEIDKLAGREVKLLRKRLKLDEFQMV